VKPRPSCACCRKELGEGEGVRSCCGRTVRVVRNGDIGYSVQLVSAKAQPRFVVSEGKLKEAHRG
jgi:hypothetical protein